MKSDAEFAKRARRRLDMTQRELAAKLGLSRYSIIRYESGIPIPERTRLAIRRLLDEREEKWR